MSDRIKSLTVVLDDVPDDYADVIAKAVGLMKGVVSVTKDVANSDHYCATANAKFQLRDKIFALLME